MSAAAQQVAHDQAEFTEETAVYEAEKARVAAMSAEERMAWEADVAACKAGDAHCFFGITRTAGVGQQGDVFRHVIKNVGKSAAVGAAQSERKDFRTGLLYGCFD